MKNKLNTWDMTLEQFISHAKSVRSPRTVQFTSQFSSSRNCGTDYYVYVDIETLEVINPYTKKHKGRKYKSFFSSIDASFAKELAYNYIKKIITEF